MIIWLTIVGTILFILGLILFIFVQTRWKQKVNEQKSNNFEVAKDQKWVYTKIFLNTIAALLIISGIVLAFSKLYI
ncbi:hypothetical protein SCLARK_00216 [Spiroplasma clarkii]|uniref:Uncharacterized protein n=1 Tax=Spiroplasma clarkii TaxID=2139 RepID=A0A1Y0KZ52_9MOLU|nr:hypothetical protein SCLARK_00216 [Spiroplasma clarkii]ATX70437.1 hypothetical protein SCLAR_v1c01020 [Spiroplasma clarkii]